MLHRGVVRFAAGFAFAAVLSVSAPLMSAGVQSAYAETITAVEVTAKEPHDAYMCSCGKEVCSWYNGYDRGKKKSKIRYVDAAQEAYDGKEVHERGDYRYVLDSETADANATIISYSGALDTAEVPANIEGHAVKTIGIHAFAENATLKSVVVPKGVKTIAEGAFGGCTALASVTLPSTLKTIGKAAFLGCTSLSRIELSGTKVKKLGAYAFSGTAITDFTVPGTVVKLCDWPLAHMHSLKTATLAEGVKSIPMNGHVFADSEKLDTVKIPASLLNICTYAFGGSSIRMLDIDPASRTLRFEGGLLYRPVSYTQEKVAAFQSGDRMKIHQAFASFDQSAFEVPAGVTSIGAYAFDRNGVIRSLTATRDCNTIKESAFANCPKLTKVVLGDKVKTVENYAFECSKVEKLKLGKKVKKVGAQAFVHDGKKGAPKSVTIPKNVKKIGVNAFGYYANSSGYLRPIKGFTVKCKKGSAAAKYAKKNGFKVKYV